MSSKLKLDTINTPSGTASITISTNGDLGLAQNLNTTSVIKNNNNLFMNRFAELSTPSVHEIYFSGQSASAYMINSVPSNTRAILCDIFLTANTADHFQLILGRSQYYSKMWVDARGQSAASQFGGQSQWTTLINTGDNDSFSPNFGKWFSSEVVPTNGNTFFWNTYGIGGTSGYFYLRVRGYSL